MKVALKGPSPPLAAHHQGWEEQALIQSGFRTSLHEVLYVIVL